MRTFEFLEVGDGTGDLESGRPERAHSPGIAAFHLEDYQSGGHRRFGIRDHRHTCCPMSPENTTRKPWTPRVMWAEPRMWPAKSREAGPTAESNHQW